MRDVTGKDYMQAGGLLKSKDALYPCVFAEGMEFRILVHDHACTLVKIHEPPFHCNLYVGIRIQCLQNLYIYRRGSISIYEFYSHPRIINQSHY